MANLSNYLENAILNHINKGTAMPQPAGLYVALFTSDPTDAATGTEVTGTGYARQSITFGAASNGAASNTNQVLFTAGAAWGTVTHAAVYDALTGGNMLWHKALPESKVVANTDELKIGVGNFTVSLD